nr:unnamed protein product [Digitaria exilis]
MELGLASRGALPAAPALGGWPKPHSLSPFHVFLGLQIHNHIYSMPSIAYKVPSMTKYQASLATNYTDTSEVVDLDWENLGFGLVETDFMYVAKCGPEGNFSKGEVRQFGPIAVSPSAGVLNYGQVPPTGKGSLYIRPLLMGSGAVLGLAPAPEYTFIIFVSPVGNYFKEGLSPINLIVEDKFHRASPGGTGGVKTIGNYASVLKAQKIAKGKGYSDVLYLDAVHDKYLEEVSSCNIFVVKDNVISTPAIKGTILPGITRKSIIEVAQSKGFKVEERLVSVDELLDVDEVFCTGTAVVVSPVGSITYMGERVEYGNQGVGVVSQQLYKSLTSLQMGLVEDCMGWTVQLNQ